MKKIIMVFVCLMTIGMFTSCDSTSPIKQQENNDFLEENKKQKAVQDSLLKVQKYDSLTQIVKKHEKKFKKEKDEFSNKVWVTPINAPKYRNQNGIFCYFLMIDEEPLIFRLVFQYYSTEWLFIRNIIFNIDGENIVVTQDMERDCGYGGYIWEWFDASYDCDMEFIEKLGNAKSVKLKLNGSQYYDTRTLTSKQIQSIKDTYEYYIALKELKKQ